MIWHRTGFSSGSSTGNTGEASNRPTTKLRQRQNHEAAIRQAVFRETNAEPMVCSN